MKITIAICTWNRCALLKETLEQISRLAIPRDVEWELLVVNNNSTDATAEVLESFATRVPVRAVLEVEPGLSNARNRAVREATGEYILWTDDDVLVDEQWMSAYHNAFLRWPEAAIFGGNVEPWFAGTPPQWLLRVWSRVATAYASRELGEQSVSLSNEVLPFGANFAVRTVEQRRYLYDPRLGVKPGSVMGGEETTVVKSMLADGIVGRWVPAARVRHYIPEARQTIEYLRKYYRGYGEYCARQDATTTNAKLLGAPRWLWREAFTEETKYRLHRYVSQPEVWIAYLIASSQAWGQLHGFKERHCDAEAERHGGKIKNEVI